MSFRVISLNKSYGRQTRGLTTSLLGPLKSGRSTNISVRRRGRRR